MFTTNLENLLAMRKLVNEQLRRQDCECLGDKELKHLQCTLTDLINAEYLRKLIKRIEDAMPDSEKLDAVEFDKDVDAFYAKKFTVGFDGMSITLPVGPEIFDGVLTALHDYYDAYYTNHGTLPAYELRSKLLTVKCTLDFINKHGSDPEALDGVVSRQYAVQDTMTEIIDDLLALF